MRHRVVALLIAAGITFALLEAALWLLVRSGVVPIRQPNYRLAETAFWSDRNPDFGVWHNPDVRTRHRKACFDVEYRSNSYGARDVERDRESADSRVVVLGDSFMEGFGLERQDRTTDRLEAHTGVAHLNFATSGNFGPTQYYLVYRTLARSFAHDAVLVGILPDNDFLDDDPDYGRVAYANRYRPYWRGEHPDYELVYFPESRRPTDTRLDRLKHALSEFTYAYNALAYVKQLLLLDRAGDQAGSAAAAPAGDEPIYSGYYDYTEAQLQRLLHNLRLIRNAADGRTVMFFTIPRPLDLRRFEATGEPPLTRALRAFARAEGMQYADLLGYLVDTDHEWQRDFHSCDDHWNRAGARTAAEFLLARMPYYDR